METFPFFTKVLFSLSSIEDLFFLIDSTSIFFVCTLFVFDEHARNEKEVVNNSCEC